MYKHVSDFHKMPFENYRGKLIIRKDLGYAFSQSYNELFYVFKEYLSMAKSINIEINLYPLNILEAYDNVLKKYNENKEN